MANNYTHKKTISDAVRIKGEVSQDGSIIKYINTDNIEIAVNVTDLFKKFSGEFITLSLNSKDEEDLSDE